MQNTRKLFGLDAIIALIVFMALFLTALSLTGCDNGVTPEGNINQTPTPTVADFTISGTETFTYDGNPKTVTVTAKAGKTSGTITIKYNGNAVAPSTVGTYVVTFDVTAVTGWNSVSGLSAGTLTIIEVDPNNQTSTAADFDISGTETFTYDGNPKTVTVIAKAGKTSGTITVKYNGNVVAPSAVGRYVVTFDVTAVTGWNSVSGLSAGMLIIIKERQPPKVIDNISDLSSYLSGQTANTEDNPFYIALNIDDEKDFAVLKKTLYNAVGKYVDLDLSGSTITTVPDWAFCDNPDNTDNTTSHYITCPTLTGIIIPDSVTSIGIGAFQQCNSLASITIPFVGNTLNGTSNTHFGYIFGASSYSDQNFSIPVLLETVIITGGNSIPQQAFYGCTGLISIIIHDGVTNIGDYAFYNCTSLTSVIIPNSVTSIGNDAFQQCSNLISVNIPNSVTNIGGYTFYSCTNLTSVTISNSVTNIGGYAFYSCTNLTSVTFEGTIPPNNFDTVAFLGDLRDKYLAGGIGTYEREKDKDKNTWTNTWTKQKQP